MRGFIEDIVKRDHAAWWLFREAARVEWLDGAGGVDACGDGDAEDENLSGY